VDVEDEKVYLVSTEKMVVHLFLRCVTLPCRLFEHGHHPLSRRINRKSYHRGHNYT
jgi:hypothetical protein